MYDNIKIEYATLETGSENINFESNNIGDTYPMTVPANGKATVIADPAKVELGVIPNATVVPIETPVATPEATAISQIQGILSNLQTPTA